MTPRILIIAGSDSGGGAGIQADIKTVTMLGGHAMTAITAVTAQNTLGVTSVTTIPTRAVLEQIDAVASDIGVDAVKIGMIGDAATARAVAERFDPARPGHEDAPPIPLVFDPVMIASSGAALADAETIAAFELLMRRAMLVTPNVPELKVLTGRDIGDLPSLCEAANALAARIGTAVLAKGGHLPGGEVTDIFVPHAGGGHVRWSDPRIDTIHDHGTGCTLASAIATLLGRGEPLSKAIAEARIYVHMALAAAPQFGGGHGPMGHALGTVPLDLIHNKKV
jgi:hydroxymethylpyrimidine/phosphomethylpyrimidine kinase